MTDSNADFSATTDAAAETIIEVPKDVGIVCPKNEKLVPLSRCERCDYAVGLVQVFSHPQPGNQHPVAQQPQKKQLHFARQYMMECGHPVHRELVALDGLLAGE